jgi:hypothetical protein
MAGVIIFREKSIKFWDLLISGAFQLVIPVSWNNACENLFSQASFSSVFTVPDTNARELLCQQLVVFIFPYDYPY